MIMKLEIFNIWIHGQPGDIMDKIAVLNLHGKPIDPIKSTLWQNNVHHPAAFLIKEKGNSAVRLNVTLRIEDAEPGKYRLDGYYGSEKNSPIFSGTFEIEDGDKPSNLTVAVSICSKPTNFTWFSGDLAWEAVPEEYGQNIKLNTTCLELYWLYDAMDYSVFRKGIPMEILHYSALACRALLSAFIQDSQNEFDPYSPPQVAKKSIIQRIVKACFFRNPPRYDIFGGANYFTDIQQLRSEEPIKFDNINIISDYGYVNILLDQYHKFIDDPYAICNCQDQAAVLLVYLSALGIADVKFCVISPFGFLSLTNLVGRGLCNNPCFKGENLDKIVNQERKDRTGFGSHCFCSLEGKWVLDSCAGPHTGSQGFKDYVDRVVDYIYPSGKSPASTTYNIYEYNQLTTSLDYIFGSSGNFHDRPHLEAFKNKLGIDKIMPKKLTEFVVRSWPNPLKCRHLRKGWEIIYQDIIAGDNTTLKTWKLGKKAERIQIMLYVSPSDEPQPLFNLFLDKGSSSTHHELPYEKGPAFLGKFAAKLACSHYSRCFWLPEKEHCRHLNILFDVISNNVTFDIEKLYEWLMQLIDDPTYIHDKTYLDAYLPHMDKIKVAEVKYGKTGGKSIVIKGKYICCPEVPVGERVTFTYTYSDNIFLDFIFPEYRPGNPCLRLLRQEDKILEFIVLDTPGKSRDTLRLAAVNKDTLLGATTDFKISFK